MTQRQRTDSNGSVPLNHVAVTDRATWFAYLDRRGLTPPPPSEALSLKETAQLLAGFVETGARISLMTRNAGARGTLLGLRQKARDAEVDLHVRRGRKALWLVRLPDSVDERREVLKRFSHVVVIGLKGTLIQLNNSPVPAGEPVAQLAQ